MPKYHCLNPIAKIGLDLFDASYSKTDVLDEADVLLVRSASVHELALPDGLLAIARAGAGVNNIPLDTCADAGVVVFNTPGANANGVKELVLAGMLLAARDIVSGVNWVEDYTEDGDIAKVTEKKKKEFAGTEIAGKTLGVVGLGAIGVLVANAAVHLGMKVIGYDPFLSVEHAWQLSRSVTRTTSLDEIYRDSDYITLHVPALADTKNMINKDSISLMKDNVVLLNFSRDVLVNADDIVDALETKKVHRYVTDFPTGTIAGVKGAIVIPHLGASTEESEDNCAVMAVKQLSNFIEHGNIVNSVNYPDLDMGPKSSGVRITILHSNEPGMLSQFTDVFAKEGKNIEKISNTSRGSFAYTIIDVEGSLSPEVEGMLLGIDHVRKVRIIQ